MYIFYLHEPRPIRLFIKVKGVESQASRYFILSFEDVPVADVGTNSFKFVYLNEEWLARFLTGSQQLPAILSFFQVSSGFIACLLQDSSPYRMRNFFVQAELILAQVPYIYAIRQCL